MLILVGLPLAIAGGLGLWHLVREVIDDQRAKDWPVAEGYVGEWEFERQPNEETTNWRLCVFSRYAASGSFFTCRSEVGKWFSDRADAEQFAQVRYPIGTPVPVHYHPTEHDRARALLP